MAYFTTRRNNSVLEVTLTRPEAHNALNAEMIAGLTKVFKGLVKDAGVRGVVLRGEGPSFCAGGDLNWMRASLKYTLARNIKDAQQLSNMYEAIFQCPVPVFAFVQGAVMGGGVGLTAVCDFVVAEASAKFCLSEVKLGLVPSIICPYVLRKVPESAARPLMLTAEIFSADHARGIGLAHFVGTANEGAQVLQEKLSFILKNGPEAVRATKALLHKAKTSSWNEVRKITVKTIAQRRVSKEGQEGMNAFFEKRPPRWREEGP